MLEERNVRKGFFEKHQYTSVRDHLPAHLRPIVTFCYITGWRVPSEVLQLQWRQVDLDAGEVRLDAGTTKNNEARTFVMTTDLKRLLKGLRDETKKLEREQDKIIPWVFHQGGTPIKSLYGAWRTACTAAGVPGRILHDFRRTAVRNLVRAGVPERVAMQITGHKTRSVFERYNIVSDGDLRDAARKLDAAV
jgi:integrase